MSNIKSQSSIIFKRLLVDSFLSYDREEVFLEDLGVVYLKGINSQDSRSESNGSGKSALVAESLIWALTGRTTRGSSQVSNIYLDRGAYVEIEFEKDDQHYLVRRGDHGSEIGNSVLIEKNGVELNTAGRITTGRAILEDEISDQLNWDVLTSIIVLAQGMEYTLSMYSPKDRRHKLEQLGNVSETFERVSGKVRLEHDKLVAEKKDLEIEKSSLQGQVTVHQSRITSAQSSIDNIINIMSNQTPEDQIRASILEKRSILSTLDEQITEKVASLEPHQTAIDDLRSKSNEYVVSKQEKSTEQSRLLSEVAGYNSQVRSSTNSIKTLDTKLESLEASLCPECNQPVDLDEVTKKTELYTSQRIEHQAVVDDLVPKIANLDVDLKKLAKEIDSIDKDLDPIQSSITHSQATLTSISREVASLNASKSDVQVQISQLESSLESVSKNYDTSSYELQINESRVEISKLNEKIAAIDAGIARVDTDLGLSQWIQSKTARDIRAYLLRGVVQYLNSRCMEYSEMLFDTMRVQMKIDKSDIDIYLGDRVIESVSGGERRRSDIIIQLALRDLVLVDSGLYSNLLVVDEALDYLDNAGVSHVLDLLTTQRSTVGSIILITHKTDADINYDRVWTVEKTQDGISRVI